MAFSWFLASVMIGFYPISRYLFENVASIVKKKYPLFSNGPFWADQPLLFWLGTALILAISSCYFLLAIDVQCNDDTYIYFNYARTFLEGHPFCYDSRGIPSEGFTSLLFLLLLLPFEALDINMMFAAALLNCFAIGLTIWLGSQIYRHWQQGLWAPKKIAAPINKGQLPAFAGLLGVLLLVAEPRTALVTGRALETMVGVAAAFWGIERFAFCLKNATSGYLRRGINSFMLASGILYLIRPELLPAMAILGLLLMIYHPNRKGLLIAGAVFGGSLLLYHLIKTWYFGDPFPTAYYRKITSDQVTGYMYVRGFILAYAWHIGVLGGLAVIREVWSWIKEKRTFWFRSPIPLGIAFVGGYNIAFYYYVMPLVEYGFRHFFPVICLLYLGIAMALFAYYGKRGIVNYSTGFTPPAIVYAFTLTILAFSIYLNPLPQNPTLNLHQKAEASTAGFYYLKLGRFIHDELPSHRQLTMVFGDAGALPYEARCRFVDLNGLSEPYIAHLFRWEDNEEKAIQYAEYILDQQPDIIVLAGDTTEGARLPHVISMHDPFRHNMHWGHYDSHKMAGLSIFKRHGGFQYLFTATGYFYPLHFLISKRSPYFQEIKSKLPAFQQEVGGYTFPSGLEVYNRRMAVCFGGVE